MIAIDEILEEADAGRLDAQALIRELEKRGHGDRYRVTLRWFCEYRETALHSKLREPEWRLVCEVDGLSRTPIRYEHGGWQRYGMDFAILWDETVRICRVLDRNVRRFIPRGTINIASRWYGTAPREDEARWCPLPRWGEIALAERMVRELIPERIVGPGDWVSIAGVPHRVERVDGREFAVEMDEEDLRRYGIEEPPF